MTLVFLAVLLAQASPAPTNAPLSIPGWQKAPVASGQYAKYVRTEVNGTQSSLIATRQVCDCQPAVAISMLQVNLSSVPGAQVRRDTVQMCGQQALRLTATGLAAPGTLRNNLEVILFRIEPAIYTLLYTFRNPVPTPDASQSMTLLCPQPSP